MQDQPQGMERRMVHRLLMHWRKAQEIDETPTLDNVLAADLDDIEMCLYVLEVTSDEAEPVFERIGQAFADEGTTALVGQPVSAASDTTLLGQAIRYYSKVQIKQIPITLGGEFTHDNGDIILYRSIIMPVRDNDGDDRYLLGAANCKLKE